VRIIIIPVIEIMVPSVVVMVAMRVVNMAK
jgi:hypothetical protein